MSLCNQVLDVADDVNRVLLKEIVKVATPPEMVKKANVSTREIKEKLNREDFALLALTKEGSELRKFAINDAANCWLSCQYFEKTAHKLPPRAQEIAGAMLKKACAIFNLEETPKLKKLSSVHTSNIYNEALDMNKVAAKIETEAVTPDDSKHFYALNTNYAMPNREYVEKAASYFVDYEKDFADASDRHMFANNVLARAKELNMPLDKIASLAKYAGEDYGDTLEIQIRQRKDLLQAKPEMSAALEKIAAYKNELPAEEFAKLLFTFDKKASLTRYYDGYLADAFKATFERRFTKQASGYSWESSDGELSCNEKELESAFEKKAEKIKGYFGVTVANQLKKHGCSLFESLPSDAKETIAKIVKGQL